MDNSATVAVMRHCAHRRRGKTISLALFAGLTLPQLTWSASNSTWKWQDAAGNITYGDAPPRGVAAEQVSVRIGSGRSVSSAGDFGASNDPGQEAAAENPTQVADARGISPERAAALCQQATTNLTILDSNALIRQTDEAGEERILDEQEKQEQIQTAREIIRYHCR